MKTKSALALIIAFLFVLFSAACNDAGNSSDKENSRDYTEEELSGMAAEKIKKPILHTFYYDYDGNGLHEAFIIAGTEDEYEEYWYNNAELWFVDGNRELKLADDIYGYPNGIQKDKKYAFLSLEKSAGGSGSVSYVYGVREGEPVKMNVSERFGDFLAVGEYKYTGVTDDFSEGFHNYITTEFVFDSEEFEFTPTGKTQKAYS